MRSKLPMQKCVLFLIIISLTGLIHPRTFGNDTEKSGDDAPEIANIAVKGGLEASDRKRVRKKIESEVGAPLNEKTLEKDRERIEAMERFVVDAVKSKAVSDADKKVNVTFKVYYGDVDIDVSLHEKGGWKVKLGPHQLLDESAPHQKIRRCRGPAIKKMENSWQWARDAEKNWHAEKQTFEAQYKWGRYSVRYTLHDNRVDLDITMRNGMDTRLSHVGLYLTKSFNFPRLPDGFWWRHHRVTTSLPEKGPPVVFGDYGQGVVAACLLGEIEKAKFGFKGKRLWVGINDLAAGEKRTVHGSVRFGLGGAAGGEPRGLVDDVYEEFAEKNPRVLNWPDRRPIGVLHPSSAAKGLFKAGNPKNPRGWNFAGGLDIRTEEGREQFKKEALDWARNCVKVCQRNNAQGMIVWSIEGQQYPHATSYIGAPDKIGRLAPEMDAVADELFEIFEEAGLRTGVTIRPQKLKIPEEVPESDSVKPKQTRQWDGDRIPVEDITETLDRKLTYAKERWGCSIFYVDSNVSSKWKKDEETGEWNQVRRETMPVEIFAELKRRHPDCLIIPEFGYFMYWAYTAPYSRTSGAVRRVWPDAFSANPKVKHYDLSDPKKVERAAGAVQRGEIILFRGWFGDSRNKVIRRLYKEHHNPEWHDPEVIGQENEAE